jgi:hypothetical protein
MDDTDHASICIALSRATLSQTTTSNCMTTLAYNLRSSTSTITSSTSHVQRGIDIAVVARDASKWNTIVDTPNASTLPTHHRQGLHQHGLHQQNHLVNTPLPKHSPLGWTHALLLQGYTTSTTTSTASNVEKLHRHYNRAHGSGKTIVGLVVSSSPGKNGGLTYDRVLWHLQDAPGMYPLISTRRLFQYRISIPKKSLNFCAFGNCGYTDYDETTTSMTTSTASATSSATSTSTSGYI